MGTTDVLYWCKEKVGLPHAVITKNGKNWYVSVEDCVITVNTHSYTVITAHKRPDLEIKPCAEFLSRAMRLAAAKPERRNY